MTTLVVSFLIILVAGGVYASSSLSTGESNKIRRIMIDLGLHNSYWSNEEGSQFYKWGWHEEQENRVSAERMVKLAFRKSGIWLDRQDLAFFEQQCKNNEAAIDIEQSVIEDRIQGIVTRSDRIRRWITKEVKEVVQFVGILTPQEAADALAKKNMEVDQEKSLDRFCQLEMQRMLYKHGSHIMALGGKGLIVEDPLSGQSIHLEGVESWLHLLRTFKDEILEFSAGRNIPVSLDIARSLKKIAETGTIRELILDIEQARKFLQDINDQFHAKEISISVERARVINAILNLWKFDENIDFTQIHQIKIRTFLARLDLAPRFREVIMNHLDEHFSSLTKVIRLFPRSVIFYGGSGSARSFASDQYSRHFLSMLETCGLSPNVDPKPPTIILISEEQIDKMRLAPKKGSNAITLPSLIEDQQRMSRLEQNINQEISDRRGWILNLSINNPTDNEFEALNRNSLKDYTRFHCQAGKDVDFLNNTYNAKKSRIQFFNMVVDTVLEMPSIQDTAPNETASASTTPATQHAN